jgi:hypothetical protein
LAKASTGQSTNILELENTAGVTVAGVDASGNPVGGLARPPMFKNLIINGDMQVAQRSSSVTGITAQGYFTADRWYVDMSLLGTWTHTVENDAPTGSGFRKSTKVLCTTADASPGSTDYKVFAQRIEGQNLQQIAKGTSSAKELTASFWVKSNVTGTYIAELQDWDNSRTVSKSYTISASATWEKKTITFPADATGAFNNDNALSLALNFWLGAGSNWTGGSPLQTSWGTGTNTRATGQTNLAASTNNYWQVTGVQLEVGSTATEFEFKPIDVELAQCQRYYQEAKTNSNDYYYAITGVASATLNRYGYCTITLPVTMRTAPTLSGNISVNAVNFTGAPPYGTGSATCVLASADPYSVCLEIYYSANMTQASGLTAVRYIELGAEL